MKSPPLNFNNPIGIRLGELVIFSRFFNNASAIKFDVSVLPVPVGPVNAILVASPYVFHSYFLIQNPMHVQLS